MRRQHEREQQENSRQMKDVVARLHSAALKGMSASAEDMNLNSFLMRLVERRISILS